jgi:hypothetical protein
MFSRKLTTSIAIGTAAIAAAIGAVLLTAWSHSGINRQTHVVSFLENIERLH